MSCRIVSPQGQAFFLGGKSAAEEMQAVEREFRPAAWLQEGHQKSNVYGSRSGCCTWETWEKTLTKITQYTRQSQENVPNVPFTTIFRADLAIARLLPRYPKRLTEKSALRLLLQQDSA